MWIDIFKKKLIPMLLMVSFLATIIPVSFCAKAESVNNSMIGGSNDPRELSFSGNWEDYLGDQEAFVYGLIINELGYHYDTFPACTELLDGSIVYGIAYTDYSECYTSEDGSERCFSAGFIPFCGELPIPQEDFDEGLFLVNLDYTDENTSFIMTYGSEAFTNHCVVYDQYLKYGVDEDGRLFFNSEKYARGNCDKDLGSLYSYDEGRYVYAVDVGYYKGITGTSLNSQIDFAELEQNISQILQTQDNNFVTVDVESCAYIAQEAVIAYLLSLQEETFLGYRVSELVEAAKELDPLECYRITADGLETISFEYDGGASATTKWLIGTGCVIVTAVAMVGAIITVECPPLSALAGAAAGTAIDLFMQVVISGETLDNVNWTKVAISAATGAVAGYLGPYINATYQGAQYFFVDSSLDALVGGIEHSVLAWMEGKDAQSIITAFGYGAALGFALSGGFKAAGGIVQKLANRIDTSELGVLANKIAPKLTKKVSQLSGKTNKVIYSMKKAADSTVFHSDYISKKYAQRQLSRFIEEGSDELVKKAFDDLGVSDIVDVNGKAMTKEQLKEMFEGAKNGATLAYFKKGDELISIVKMNGMVGIVFDPSKYQTVTIPGGLINDRNTNMEEAARLLKEQWIDDSSLIPESLATAIKNKGVELEDMMPKDLVRIIKKSDWVLHENIDMQTVSLVPRLFHDKDIGGISHMGGFALAKYIKEHMGREFFERFVSAVSTNAVIATN